MTKNCSKRSDAQGRIEFRGFYGKYEIKIEQGNGVTEVKFIHLAEKGVNEFTFVMGN